MKNNRGTTEKTKKNPNISANKSSGGVSLLRPNPSLRRLRGFCAEIQCERMTSALFGSDPGSFSSLRIGDTPPLACSYRTFYSVKDQTFSEQVSSLLTASDSTQTAPPRRFLLDNFVTFACFFFFCYPIMQQAGRQRGGKPSVHRVRADRFVTAQC